MSARGSNKGRGTYVVDRRLVPRIKNYLHNNKIVNPNAYLPVEDIVSFLQQRFPEYRRKSLVVIRTAVDRALPVALEEYFPHNKKGGKDRNNSGESDSDSEDSEDSEFDLDPDVELMEVKNTNMLNASLRKAYKPANAPASPSLSAQPQPASAPLSASNPMVLDTTPAYYAVDSPASAASHFVPMPSNAPASPVQAPTNMLAAYAPKLKEVDRSEVDSGSEGRGRSGAKSADKSAQRAKRKRRESKDQDGMIAEDDKESKGGKDKKGKKTKKAAVGGSSLNASNISPKQMGLEGGGDAGGGQADDESLVSWSIPTVRYSDLGGIDEVLQEITELIEWPLTHPELYAHLGVKPSLGILLHGPAGCGKTTLAHAIAGEMQRPFFNVSAPEIVTGMSGQSEAKIRKLFASARAEAPSIIFIDEIDAVAPRRETTQREMSRRIVAQFLTCLDELSMEDKETSGTVVVIGATSRPDSIDPSLRRAGRFARELALGIPDEPSRTRILEVLTKGLRLSGNFNFRDIAHKTPGYVGADLSALCQEAANVAVTRIFNELGQRTREAKAAAAKAAAAAGEQDGAAVVDLTDTVTEQESDSMDIAATPDSGTALVPGRALTLPEIKRQQQEKRRHTATALREIGTLTSEALEPLTIAMEDFEEAIKRVQPTAKREGFATVPDVSWDDVGALEPLREELNYAILQPIRKPEIYGRMGLSSTMGVLLFGPPGCGKTLLAKAIANECGFNFISVKGPELLNKYVGESERSVREVFLRGKASSPCIIFFDEFDALAPKRDGDSSNQATQRVVNQLLTELDGLDNRKNVSVIAATNRPDIIDSAILRPGRLDKPLYVPLPGPADRAKILATLLRNIPHAADLDLEAIGHDARCNRFSGADLHYLVREASLIALKDALAQHPDMHDPDHPGLMVQKEHLDRALNRTNPSVSEQDEIMYLQQRQHFSAVRE